MLEPSLICNPQAQAVPALDPSLKYFLADCKAEYKSQKTISSYQQRLKDYRIEDVIYYSGFFMYRFQLVSFFVTVLNLDFSISGWWFAGEIKAPGSTFSHTSGYFFCQIVRVEFIKTFNDRFKQPAGGGIVKCFIYGNYLYPGFFQHSLE